MELSRLGWQVTVLAADYRGGERIELQEERVSFLSVPVKPVTVARYVSRAHDIAAESDPDIVIASTDTHFGWLGARVARKQGATFVFDLYDNYFAFKSSRIPGFKRLLRDSVMSADLTVVVSRALGELHPEASRTVLIPNGVDVEMFRPKPRIAARRAHNIDSRATVIGYFGAVQADRGLDTLFEAARILRSVRSDIRVLLAGKSNATFDFPDFADYRGDVEQSVVASMINACDVVVLPYPDTEWARYTSANKVYEYIACRVPMVVTSISDYAELAARPEAVTEPSAPRNMARAISFQLDNRALPRVHNVSWAARALDLDSHLRSLN